MKKRLHQTLVILCVTATLVAWAGMMIGCGSEEPAIDSSASASTSAGFAASLPDSIKQSGVLKVGTNMPYPPFEFYEADGKTPTGVEVELVEGIAKNLGLKTQWLNMNWDGLVPALVSKRFDMVAATLADYTDRQKIVTMIDFCKNGSGAVVLTENASQLTKPEDLAGKTVGVLKGAIAASQLKQLSAKLQSSGMAAIDLKMFPDDNAGLAAVKSGRVLAHIADVPTAGYIVKTAGAGTLALVLPNLLGEPLLQGMAVRKDEGGLATAIQAGLNQMIQDGTYAQILDKYGVPNVGIPAATINGGTTSSGE
jgi:polar amino acid transport system substrate-binding protein